MSEMFFDPKQKTVRDAYSKILGGEVGKDAAKDNLKQMQDAYKTSIGKNIDEIEAVKKDSTDLKTGKKDLDIAKAYKDAKIISEDIDKYREYEKTFNAVLNAANKMNKTADDFRKASNKSKTLSDKEAKARGIPNWRPGRSTGVVIMMPNLKKYQDVGNQILNEINAVTAKIEEYIKSIDAEEATGEEEKVYAPEAGVDNESADKAAEERAAADDKFNDHANN